MTRDEVDRLRAGDVIEFSAAGYQAQWTIHDIVRHHKGSVLDITACVIDPTSPAQPVSINITELPEHWTLIGKVKQSRPDVHPLEQLRQRLDNNNDT